MKATTMIECLRRCSGAGYEECDECAYCDRMDCTMQLMADAADVIEQLKKGKPENRKT